MELDNVDITIINELMNDGCLSLRDLSKKTGISAPAVSSRIKRLRDAGVILGTTLIIDKNKVSGLITSFFLIKCDPSKLESTAGMLSTLDEVTQLFTLTGSYSLMAKVELDDMNSLGSFVEKLGKIEGVIEFNTLIINKYFKEQQKPFNKINLKCEYCGNIITGKPYRIEYRGITRFLCCPTCLGEFKKKYGI